MLVGRAGEGGGRGGVEDKVLGRVPSSVGEMRARKLKVFKRRGQFY